MSNADTTHQHLHIVANRIGFDKKTVSDSNNYIKMSAFCRDMEQKFKLEEVLSPTKFLREEMRQIPRSDTRKSAMKNDVKACLISSKNYNEFQASMKARNYDVIRGRGIAFIDSKGVYAKGSELGYSLATIEKILQLSLHQKQTLFIKARPKGFLQKNTPNYGQRESKSLSEEMSKDMQIQRNKLLDDLLKPTYSESKIPHELLRKKKKRHSQHL